MKIVIFAAMLAIAVPARAATPEQDLLPAVRLITDSTAMAPLNTCFGGPKALVDHQGRPQYTEDDLRENLQIGRAGVPAVENEPYPATWASTRYQNRVQLFLDRIVKLALQPKPDTRRMAALAERVQHVTVPPASSSTEASTIIETQIQRECVLEFIAEAYGVGPAAPAARYEKSLAAWRAAGVYGSKPSDDHYIPALVGLNYMLAQLHLQAGHREEALGLSTDPVMLWAVSHLEFTDTADWVASFYTFGIGTPPSVEKAAEVYIKNGSDDAVVTAAELYATIGKKDKALPLLVEVMRHNPDQMPVYKRANGLYASQTGRGWARPAVARQPSAIEAAIMLPLAVIAYCASNIGTCSTESKSGTGAQSAQDLRNEFDSRRRECKKNLNETVMLGYSLANC